MRTDFAAAIDNVRRDCDAVEDHLDADTPHLTDQPRKEAAVTNTADLPAPEQGLLVTHFLTVSDVARSRTFYADIFGGRVVLNENPCIVKVANSWIIMNPGGGPTPDKPDVVLRPPEATDIVSAFLNVRVADIAAFYSDARRKGAEFLTEPLDRKAEIRCYMRDPDGYLIEIGQATGMLEGIYADL
ncbi:VOC family protein [Nocardia sp. NPDC051990]|uniref:VOC family protein n=1 Tax=Nocardia sp. NPDC051990 TaxID=3155285 RepID=UPI00343E0CCB